MFFPAARRWLSVVLLAVSGFLPSSASAGMTPEEVKMFERFKPLAEKGDRSAQANLGTYYAYGRGVAKDEVEGARWLRKAAEQGDVYGQTNLGYCYAYGRGVAKDMVEAAKWYRKAADQGYPPGQKNLGYCYANGTGVAKDMVEAVKWWRRAADQGYSSALYSLGNYYAYSRGVAKDVVEAYAYYSLASMPKELSGKIFDSSLPITIENARRDLAILEKRISSDVRLRGQRRTLELQKEIEAKIAAKKAGN
jgi:TPR repeat protein